MKIAVLIPIKNCASTILRSLNSVVNQTYFKNLKNDYIIYLIDDHSTDNVYEIIKDFENLIYLKNKNHGLSSALNTGLFKIMNDDSIEYIARLDGDDEWHLNKIEIQMEFLKNNPDIDICGTGLVLLGKTNNFYGIYSEKHEDIINDINIRNVNSVCHASVIYNKRIFYKCGVYDDMHIRAEDFYFWKKCIYFDFKFYNIPLQLMNVQGKEIDFTSMGLNF